jgi:hypothetical protein
MSKSNSSSGSKIDENQLVTTSAWWSLFALGLALTFITFPMWRGSRDKNAEKSIIKAQSVGYQAAAIEQKKSFENKDQNPTNVAASRAPASIENEPELASGILGQDSWGQPFHYKIRLEGNQKVVDVWSEGENAVRTQVLIPLNTSQSVQVPF